MIAVDRVKHQKKLEAIDIGTRAKEILNDLSINSDDKKEFRLRCLAFYKAATTYLIDKLPISSHFLKDSQYLQPEKRNSISSLNAISRLSRTVGNALKNHLPLIFHVSQDINVQDLCDLIKDQWQIYQLLEINKDWFKIETSSAKEDRRNHENYWKGLEKSWIEVTPKEDEEKFLRIDSFWSRIMEVKDDEGRLRFPQLGALVI